jgi:hypothetical protein
VSDTKFTKRRAIWVLPVTREQFIVDADDAASVVSRYPNASEATEVDRANAALDVAAPDMYEALEQAYQDLFGEGGGVISEATGLMMYVALAKARGEAQS